MQRSWLEENKEKIEKEEENIKKALKTLPFVKDQNVKDHITSLIKDGAAIRVFMSDQNAIDEGLKKLNDILTNEEKNFPGQKKLLRTIIEQELAKLGFEGKMAKTHDLLTSSVFLFAVAKKTMIKDPGAPISHGEFTHAIQWLLIGWGNEKYHFLSKTPADFFKEMGGLEGASKKDYSVTRSYAELWNAITDEEHNKLLNPQIKFTCPDLLNKYIIFDNAHTNKFPLLYELCFVRQHKRMHQRTHLGSNDLYEELQLEDEKETKLLWPKNKT